MIFTIKYTSHVSTDSKFWKEGTDLSCSREAIDSTSDNVFRIRKALSIVKNHLDLNRTTLIDLGCGKGRLILIASKYSFNEIVGVELSNNIFKPAKIIYEKKD